jgi:hypothetical protein
MIYADHSSASPKRKIKKISNQIKPASKRRDRPRANSPQPNVEASRTETNMQRHIRKTANGTIDYDFYRARARAERRMARCTAIRMLVQLFRRTGPGALSFQARAAARV